MKLHELKPAVGSTKNIQPPRKEDKVRVGVLLAWSKGCAVAFRFTTRSFGFEGVSDAVLTASYPEFGFKNNNKFTSRVINLDALEELAQKTKASALSVQLMWTMELSARKQGENLGEGECEEQK